LLDLMEFDRVLVSKGFLGYTLIMATIVAGGVLLQNPKIERRDLNGDGKDDIIYRVRRGGRVKKFDISSENGYETGWIRDSEGEAFIRMDSGNLYKFVNENGDYDVNCRENPRNIVSD
jgi:hypothetical protein